MKKLLSVCMFLFLVSTVAFANPFDKFNSVLNSASSDSQAKRYLNHLASDMGAVMTGGNFGVSAGLGLANLDVSLKLNTVNVDSEIIRAEGTTQMYVPMLYASLGLPFGFEVLVKYGYFYESNLYGAGLRYTVYESSTMFIPSITVQGIYTMTNVSVNGNKFDGNNIALGAIATFPIPFVTPYVAVGWDKTEVEAKSSDREGMTGSSDGVGYSLGVAISVFVLNGNVGVTYCDGVPNYTFGLSLGF